METVTPSGNGTYNTPSAFVPTVPGTYQWVVSFAGDGNNSTSLVTVGNGNDNIRLGNGNNTVTVGSGNDQVQAGNGNNIAALDQILSEWIDYGSSSANVAAIRSQLGTVTCNATNANKLQAGSGLDWFWYTDGKDQSNRKATDLLN